MEHTRDIVKPGEKRFATCTTLSIDGETPRDFPYQMDCGPTCKLISYADCCGIAQDRDPKLQESDTKLRFYDKSTAYKEEHGSINQTEFLKVTDHSLGRLQQKRVIHTIRLAKDEVPLIITKYWEYHEELTAPNGVLFKGSIIIISRSTYSRATWVKARSKMSLLVKHE
ncbi:hypothetical protein OS493_031550 [Desmophyllum pertusum]|uniref:Uncharacterized protein n=1 Tax=Desmophyllum pertusum TaxID=174260 RepID=A0A9X0CR84_9CNID|nr:hypothetical protein OS493_031550 [Desmophyllum pertusum]